MKSILVCGFLYCIIGSITLFAGHERGREERGSGQAGQLIERMYDRFKDETTVKLKPQKIREIAKPREELSISIEATLKGERGERPKEVVVVFDSSSEKLIYYREAEVIFLVDGKRVDAGTAFEMTNVRLNAYTEEITLKLNIPFDKFSEIMNGKSIEFRLGKVEHKMPAGAISAIRAFMKEITS